MTKIKNHCTIKLSTVLLGNSVSCFRCDQLSGWGNSTLILSKRVVQDVSGFKIKDCDSVVHCTQSIDINVLAGGDEFAAAFESRVAHFELYDGVRLLLTVIIGDEESTVDQRATGVYGDTSIGCARVPPAGRRAFDACAQN